VTRDEILAVIRRRTAAINRHALGELAALYAADCVIESPLAAGTVEGRQAVTKVHQALFDAFPDLSIAEDRVLIDGDQAAVTGVVAGTYTGGFMGLAPSGNPIRFQVVMVMTFRDGLIVSERRIYDFTGMLVQAGVLKARPA
jgi:steroid delta-isomerase-like uncharacterized protein